MVLQHESHDDGAGGDGADGAAAAEGSHLYPQARGKKLGMASCF